MPPTLPTSLEECFSDLPAPRVQGRCDYKLMDILMIAVCAVLCGADSWVGVVTVAKAKAAWFRQFLKLENCIPLHDTFGDVFAKIDPKPFIRDEKTNYILRVKDNHSQLNQDIED